MKLPKLKKGDKIIIDYIDCYDPKLEAWSDDKAIMTAIKSGTADVESIGYFYGLIDGYIFIYGDKMDETYSRVTGIPAGCVKRIKRTK